MKREEYRKIKRNLKAAIKAVRAHPAERFDLCSYHEPSSCGTFYCTAGLLTTVPHFREQGLYLKRQHLGYSRQPALRQIRKDDTGIKWADTLFGEGSFNGLFSAAGGGKFDHQLSVIIRCRTGAPSWQRVSDKDLAIARLVHALHNLESVK